MWHFGGKWHFAAFWFHELRLRLVGFHGVWTVNVEHEFPKCPGISISMGQAIPSAYWFIAFMPWQKIFVAMTKPELCLWPSPKLVFNLSVFSNHFREGTSTRHYTPGGVWGVKGNKSCVLQLNMCAFNSYNLLHSCAYGTAFQQISWKDFPNLTMLQNGGISDYSLWAT